MTFTSAHDQCFINASCLLNACLSNHSNFIDNIFIVSLAAFKPGNHLYPILLWICAASLVMYHNQLTADLPLNPAIFSKLLKVACKAMIHHVGSRDSAPEVVLTDSWSTTTSIIYKDFCSQILNLSCLQLKYGNWLQLQPLLPAGSSSSSTNQHPEYCAQ
jgi:hypothetical protein